MVELIAGQLVLCPPTGVDDMRRWLRSVVGAAALLLPGAVTHADLVRARQDEAAFRQVGVASWYGPGFHGRRTASGERFDQNDLTAAHRKLPLGSEVKVTNLANGRSVTVAINDRGPYAKGRVLDLSEAAARKLGMVEDGVAKVRIEATHSQLAAAARSASW
jgi:rare lipoprotein A (peptidoglycan hydrolase)